MSPGLDAPLRTEAEARRDVSETSGARKSRERREREIAYAIEQEATQQAQWEREAPMREARARLADIISGDAVDALEAWLEARSECK